MKTKDLIKNLYEENYFKLEKTFSQVKLKLNEMGFNPFPSELSKSLAKANFLRRLGKKGSYEFVQKQPPKKEDSLEVFYFDSNKKPSSARRGFYEILRNISGDCLVCDGYLNEDTLMALEKMNKSKIKFLTTDSKQKNKISQKDLSDFKQENLNIEFKGISTDCLHDRYIITKNKIILLGHGFSIRKKESFVLELPKKSFEDLYQGLNNTFNQRWKSSRVL